ncbi:MAG: DNA polymerase I, partial [Lysobacterales bacterium]
DSLTLARSDVVALRSLFARYGFTQALREFGAEDGGVAGPPSSPTANPVASGDAAPTAAATSPAQIASVDRSRYETILERSALDAWIQKLRDADLWSFDTETTSVDSQRAEIVGVSFACAPNEAAYVPLAHDYQGAPAQLGREEVLVALKPLLEAQDARKIAQHAKYDINVLAHHGIEVAGVAYDTMLESFVLDAGANRHDMDSLSARHLGHRTIAYDEVAGKGAKQIPFAHVALDDATRYAAEDADVTLRLHLAMWPQLESLQGPRFVFEAIEMPLVPVLARMERAGVLIDGKLLGEQTRVMRRRMAELIGEAHAAAGHPFSLDSPKQLQTVLFEQLKLPVTQKTPGGQASTNEEALAEIAVLHPLPRLILDYRMLAKLVSTYTEKLPAAINPRTGRVHTSYHQAGAATGRLASSDPNLQNIPIKSEEGRRIRQAFIAPPGFVLIAADYSQIELRIMAHLSGDSGLLAAFRDGIDVHRATAAEVFGVDAAAVDAAQRRAAKAINFGLMYGMGAHGLARQIDVDRKTAQDYMDRYFGRYPGVRAFMAATRERARRDGYVETVYGRRLYLANIASRNAQARAGAERAAINAPMQGTAADVIKRAMIEVDAWLRNSFANRARMLMQVHDELVLEVAENDVDEVRDGLRERMMAAAELAVPLEVDVGTGPNWDAAH